MKALHVVGLVEAALCGREEKVSSQRKRIKIISKRGKCAVIRSVNPSVIVSQTFTFYFVITWRVKQH